jgi:hypothetical protein
MVWKAFVLLADILNLPETAVGSTSQRQAEGGCHSLK